jgi:hypothetical protein
MNYTQNGERVTLDMSQSEFNELVLILGYAAGAANQEGDRRMFYRLIAFANAVNEQNPNWRRYEIPEEMRAQFGARR